MFYLLNGSNMEAERKQNERSRYPSRLNWLCHKYMYIYIYMILPGGIYSGPNGLLRPQMECSNRIERFTRIHNYPNQTFARVHGSRTRRYVLLLSKRTCLLGQQEDMSCCSTGRHAFWLCNKKTCLPAQIEHMSSCWTGRQEREDIFVSWTRRYVFQ